VAEGVAVGVGVLLSVGVEVKVFVAVGVKVGLPEPGVFVGVVKVHLKLGQSVGVGRVTAQAPVPAWLPSWKYWRYIHPSPATVATLKVLEPQIQGVVAPPKPRIAAQCRPHPVVLV
jgi:hypothetical protein